MSPSQKTNLFNSSIAAWIILLCVLVVWSYFSFTNWIGDSEFWPITLSGHFDQWKTQPALLMKPLFHLSLSWIYLFDLDSATHLKVAKVFYTILGSLSFVFTFILLKREVRWQKALLIVLIFLFSHLGFTQIGLIRSDFLSFFLVLIFFLLVPKIPTASWVKFGFFNFLFTILLYLASPKSLFFSVLIFVYSLFRLDKGSKFRYILLFGWICILSFLAVDRLILDGMLTHTFQVAVDFAAEAYYSPNALPFFNLHIKSFLQNDVLIWTVLLAGLIWQIYDGFKNQFQAWTALGIVTLLAIIIHKPVLPFFVGSYWGILFLSCIPLFRKISFKYLSLMFSVFLLVFLFRFSSAYHYSNEVQLQTVTAIENYVLDIPQAKMFDGLGVAPRVSNYLFYLGPDEKRSNIQVWNHVQDLKPEIIIYTARLGFIKEQIDPFLQHNYEPVGVGYWVRKDLNTKKELWFLKPAFFVFGYFPMPEML